MGYNKYILNKTNILNTIYYIEYNNLIAIQNKNKKI